MRDFIVRTLLAALIALMPSVADAAGLGRLTILSALGQPLSAEIDLVSVAKEELSSLNARLASPDAYRQANLQFSAALAGVRLSIERRPNGQPYIRITSTRPVNEPFIDLLVELTWASGRLTREYTALIDPPGMGPMPGAAPVLGAPEVRPAPAPQPPVAVAPAVEPAAPVRPRVAGKEYGPIQRGDTLGKIAKSVMPEGVSLEQMLIGLQRSNPDAFIRNNVNLVRAGKILRVPEKEEVAAISRQEAVKEFRAQVADWNAYRQKLAEAAGVVSAEGRTAVTGRITTSVEDKAAGGGPKDVVRLSKGEPPGAAAKGKPRSTAERIRTLEEEVIAREKALGEANERVVQLEKTIKDMQKLIELKSPALAAAQQKGAPPKPEAAPAPEPKPKPEAVAVTKPEPAPAPKPEATAPSEKPEAKPAPKPEQAAAPAQPRPKVAPTPPPPPPEPSLLEQILEEPLYLAAGGGVIVLGGLGFWMARRRRVVAETEDAGVPRAAPKLDMGAPVAAGATAGAAAAAATAETEITPAAAAAAPLEEVDPLAEAEVYIAYGRDGQAEEILKEALAKNRNREDVQLKLLEIYAARKDKSAFGRLASEFNKLTGGAGGNWLKVAAMGYAIDPANALYEAGKSASAAAPLAAAGPITGSDLDFDLGLGSAGLTTTDIELEAGAAKETETAVLEPGALQGMAEDAKRAGSKEARPMEPDFTLDVPEPEETPTKSDAARGEAAQAEDTHGIDFQIELPRTEVPGADDQPTVAAKTPGGGVDFKLDIGDINLNLGGKPGDKAAAGEKDKDGHWYDVQTKFDLAKAYQEMGDKDGAKEILQEVISEGDAEQKAQAKALLENLG